MLEEEHDDPAEDLIEDDDAVWHEWCDYCNDYH